LCASMVARNRGAAFANVSQNSATRSLKDFSNGVVGVLRRKNDSMVYFEEGCGLVAGPGYRCSTLVGANPYWLISPTGRSRVIVPATSPIPMPAISAAWHA